MIDSGVVGELLYSPNGIPKVICQRTTDGKAKATVTPNGSSPVFFLRMKMK